MPKLYVCVLTVHDPFQRYIQQPVQLHSALCLEPDSISRDALLSITQAIMVIWLCSAWQLKLLRSCTSQYIYVSVMSALKQLQIRFSEQLAQNRLAWSYLLVTACTI